LKKEFQRYPIEMQKLHSPNHILILPSLMRQLLVIKRINQSAAETKNGVANIFDFVEILIFIQLMHGLSLVSS
jgi:hypothetical protein